MTSRYTSVAALTALALLPVPSGRAAAAQSASSETPQNQDAPQLKEVVVTAEKRATNIQDTPISLTAIAGTALQAQGISNPEDAIRQVPGVALASAGPGQTEYTIRGLSSSGPAVGTVGFYLDDAPMTAPAGAQNGKVAVDPDLYDLDRVEVLRGPQGTLYGAGSMGGTIKLITHQPDVHAFAASGQLDLSQTEGGSFNHDASAMLNLPLIAGKLALRLVGTDDHLSGWIHRIVLADFPLPTGSGCSFFQGCMRGDVANAPVSRDIPRENAEDVKGGRGTLRLMATDRLTVTGGFFYQTIAQNGLSYYDNPPAMQARFQPFDVPEPFTDTFRLYNLVANLDLSQFTVTSATSYWARGQFQSQDVSEAVETLFDLPSFDTGNGGAGPVTYAEDDRSSQTSEELRLTSKGSARLQWLLGAFYSNYHFRSSQVSAAEGFVPLFGTDNLFTSSEPDHLTQRALFGELSYDLTPRLEATAGLRYYSYQQNGAFISSGIVTSSPTPIPVSVAASNSGINPKYTLSYDVAHEFMIYATAAKGFRPGAGDQPIPTSGADSCLPALEAIGRNAAPTQYNPDTVWSYELGEKATLLDRRLTLDSAVYYERWTDVQQEIGLACGFGFVGNVGSADVRGAEMELDSRLTRSWTFVQSGGYTHAVVASTLPGTSLLAGQRLLNVPTYSASTSLVYTHNVRPYTLVLRVSNVVVGPSENLNYSLSTVHAYDIASARVGLLADRWSAYLFVDNVANTRAALYTTHNYALDIPSVNRIATNPPRTVGVSIQYHY